MRNKALIHAGLLWLAVFLLPVWALADESSDACLRDAACSALFNQARDKSLAGDLEGALKLYQDAYAAIPAPWLLLNTGRVLQKLGRNEESIDHYQRYLLSKPSDPAGEERAHRYLEQVQGKTVTATRRPLEPQRRPGINESPSHAFLPSDVALPSVPNQRPVYKTWWIWTLTGVAAAGVATSVGLGVALASPSRSGPTLHPFQ